ncbi:ATP-dependent helicase/nuclease subunit A [Rhodobacteraceae bacterium THAF1]|uniref:double-strand break repair helicase AddA n=1 Tax=Palleronia sp. THAF1 TaxID=2587842 RepID=UPI000F3D83C6|nr:double-strand break repair helicase AddA [Palleronia sp. THAF1]QFU10139.1 ATP-dependent helicase/nuclease subunit A [Palleronia sp. THAF1]VDC16956.1 ATP-dependent helicase/nuclease subunit A [Rhodobacteraceae bacterium THAF1]
MNDANARQITAAQPALSTWLSANAGSGKTRVLTNRVARLLLSDVDPTRILCLTYTKAAASEMQNRLFATLGRWAMMPDDSLRAELADLGESAAADLAKARRLFAKAIETPGGLRIQTIHSFCAVLLRRFPLEAGVTPRFTEMDDRAAAQLRADCLEELAETQPDLMHALARQTGDINGIVGEITGRRDAVRPATEADLRAALDLGPDITLDSVLAQVFDADTESVLTDLRAVLASGSKTDMAAQAKLQSLRPPYATGTLAVLEDVMITGASAKAPFSAKIGSFPTKASRAALNEDTRTALDALMERVEAARATRLALATLDRSLTLHAFADAFLTLYAKAKEARGWLDFDDLILGARTLLSRSEVAEWVLYRLDGGIDHILVDEAQDTAPAQWDVIEALSREFASGQGARDAHRTIFVVGDKKQSIYSFQGADPEGFDRMHDHFAGQLGADALQRLELQHSFRSAPAILRAVDAVFADGLGGDVQHIAFKDTMPGRVDLWPLTEGDPPTDPPDWQDPVDREDPESAIAKLSRQIAKTVRGWLDAGETIPDGKGGQRKLGAGDILVLVRSRSGLFHPLIRACKAKGIEIAGADVLELESDLAVRDLLSLLRFLALPDDDMSLAEALRSPLFGLSESDLYHLAQGRTGTLWKALRESDHDPARETIGDLLNNADFLRPYELLDRILLRHRGRERLLGRLGMESEDAIDALLAQALGYERTDIPSLTGFLAWFDAETVKIKRQSDSAGGRLRVMTVHGAKGLEAPVVILADTTKVPRNDERKLLAIPGGPTLWKPAKPELPPVLTPITDALDAAAAAERDRLLYVAMTRAESWLVVCGAELNTLKNTWYEQIATGLEALDHEPLDVEPGTAKRFASGNWGGLEQRDGAVTDVEPAPLEGWFHEMPPAPDVVAPLLTPSSLGRAKALSGEVDPDDDPDAALIRGTRIHLLLEHLPPDRPDDWPALARRLLGAEQLSDATQADLLAEAAGVLTNPTLAALLQKPALTEVDLTAPHPSGARIAGTVDRLVITPDRITAIDYKSNRLIPDRQEDVPDGLLRQMGAYAHALAAIYPDRQIETALLWTRAPRLMPMDPDRVAAAFASALP